MQIACTLGSSGILGCVPGPHPVSANHRRVSVVLRPHQWLTSLRIKFAGSTVKAVFLWPEWYLFLITRHDSFCLVPLSFSCIWWFLSSFCNRVINITDSWCRQLLEPISIIICIWSFLGHLRTALHTVNPTWQLT